MSFKIGIDPGLSGAIIAMSEDHSRISLTASMPVMSKTHGTGQQVDGGTVATIIESLQGCDGIYAAYIERVSARPGQGVTSMFAFGHGVGIIEGVLSALRVPTHWVLPTRWKRAAGLLKADKDASRTMVMQMHPELAQALKHKKSGQAIADAILIARYGA